MSALKGDDGRELLQALRNLRDAGLDPTVIEIVENESADGAGGKDAKGS